MSNDPASDFALSMINTTPVTRTPENKATYRAFQKCFKLPYWENTMCHTTKSHKFDRQVTWLKIAQEFKLTKQETSLVQHIYKESSLGWSTSYDRVKVSNGNKARAINNLVKKEALKVVDGDVIMNPAIVIARDGWSQYLLGVMLVQWMNERFVFPDRAPDAYSKSSIQAGAQFAHEDQTRMVIPHSVKGRVQGNIA